jgi:hypothetical protein
MLAALEANVVIFEAGPMDRVARAVSIPDAVRTKWLLDGERAGPEAVGAGNAILHQVR